jgi:hypothetical protein
MPHLRLVPPLPAGDAATEVAVPEQRSAQAARRDALAFFQSASGLCLCTDCSKARHPAYGAR